MARKVRLKKSSSSSSRPQKTTKKGGSPRTRRSVFSVRQLPIDKHKNFSAYLKDINQNWEQLQALKEDDEFWGFEIGDEKKRYKSYAVYEDLGLVAQKLMSYQSVKESGSKGGKKFEELTTAVRFVRFKGTAKQWKKAKEKEISERKAREKKLEKKVRTLKKKERKATKTEKKLKQQVDKLKRTLKHQQKEIKKSKGVQRGKKSEGRKQRAHRPAAKKTSSRKATSTKRTKRTGKATKSRKK